MCIRDRLYIKTANERFTHSFSLSLYLSHTMNCASSVQRQTAIRKTTWAQIQLRSVLTFFSPLSSLSFIHSRSSVSLCNLYTHRWNRGTYTTLSHHNLFIIVCIIRVFIRRWPNAIEHEQKIKSFGSVSWYSDWCRLEVMPCYGFQSFARFPCNGNACAYLVYDSKTYDFNCLVKR